MRVKLKNYRLTTIAMAACCAAATMATERRFTYTYEPETMLEGTMEYEQWVTLRTQRSDETGQDNYNRWEIRSEFEYGVTDRYTVGFYLNTEATSFRDIPSGGDKSDFDFKGISIENRYMVLNPAEHPIGLTLYLEPGFSGDEAEIEEKILIGQRFGNWKWAINLIHATEWEDNLHTTEGEVEGTFGITGDLGKNWSLGVEARNVSVIPEYKDWEYTAVYVGPVVSYRKENWWVTLSVMPQVFGRNFEEDSDRHHNLVLDEQERLNVRFLFGISF
jgi:hypothetical protein